MPNLSRLTTQFSSMYRCQYLVMCVLDLLRFKRALSHIKSCCLSSHLMVSSSLRSLPVKRLFVSFRSDSRNVTCASWSKFRLYITLSMLVSTFQIVCISSAFALVASRCRLPVSVSNFLTISWPNRLAGPTDAVKLWKNWKRVLSVISGITAMIVLPFLSFPLEISPPS